MKMLFVSEMKSRHFWASALVELISTFFFIFLTTGTTITWNINHPPSTELISLSFGFSIATLAMCSFHLSGGHINPAVTIAMMAIKKVTILRGVTYVIFQLVGGIAGSAVLKFITPEAKRGTLGATVPGPDVTPAQAVGIEILLTFLLVFTVCASTDSKRLHYGYEVPLSIGLCVAVCHFIGIGFTGCGINPARSFGPAVVMNKSEIWQHHWVYWAGPIGGALLAAVLYQVIFRARQEMGPTASATTNDLEMNHDAKL
ncbi:PREDICTED: aquaporin-4-like [Acropora digitifera]|uniref:aquaporin-4-like n=1 Tax=Acropora digitifera TaxID=70779 RepID=UPI00077B1973|nr:PREDICTED: aquaporin-4-like [Acropora digitifera]